MKYVGRLVLLAQTTLIAGWLNAGTVTVNGLNCGRSEERRGGKEC